MGQYYFLVNVDKKEYVNPWKIDGLAKLWEWSSDARQAGILVFLTGWSTGAGGGDPEWDNPIVKEIAGRWAGDRIAFIGDYHKTDHPKSKGLPCWKEIEEHYTEISKSLIPAWNNFIGDDDLKIKLPDSETETG